MHSPDKSVYVLTTVRESGTENPPKGFTLLPCGQLSPAMIRLDPDSLNAIFSTLSKQSGDPKHLQFQRVDR